ncbi:S24 family peptidase [Cytophagaceae bacterium DM2B3-1]|uniref:S24 family peptidase n=1 Tax=Xanthocytophaga flava TaxID=3048013 RepID=A0AAE3QUF3_9BACT|nr:helix-turn-helix domain-containing protein [Xanthocytophaga flavus]MDJ1472470.1 S24 family peptidase [Xanthocytophaga flavus]MDJ1483665.1 S24 family peptidase [Xanthocytophaga flavus]MDJ1497808.1 S24 family peptidase [Xanthocytophaga flavus]
MTPFSTYAQRFKQLRKAAGLNQQEFGEKLEITQSSISQIESGKNLPSTAVLEKLVEIFPNLNKQWLYHGEGEMFLNTTPPTPAAQRILSTNSFLGTSESTNRDWQRIQAENDMLKARIELIEETNDDLYRKRKELERENEKLRLDKDTSKGNVVERVITQTERIIQPFAVTVNQEGTDNILMVSTKAAAGYMQGCVEPEYIRNLPAFSIPSVEFRNGTFRAFQVTGQSMEPTLHTGDWLVCEFTEKLKDIRSGEMYVVVSDTKESVVVKRVEYVEDSQKLYLQSDNSIYPTYSIATKDVKEIWKVKAHMNMQPVKGFLYEVELELAKMKDQLQELQRRIG